MSRRCIPSVLRLMLPDVMCFFDLPDVPRVCLTLPDVLRISDIT